MGKRGKRRIEGSSNFGHRIRELRERRGLTLVQLAQLVGSSATHLSAIETGKVTNPGVELVHRIATALDTSVLIGSQSENIGQPDSLAYESPLQIGQEPGVSNWEAVRQIESVLNDRRLTQRQQGHIAEQLAAYAGWLRDQQLDNDAKGKSKRAKR